MVRTRLTAAEPYTAGRLDVEVELDADETVAALEATITGLAASDQTKLWLGDRELPREATVRAAGIRDGVVVCVGGPSREPKPARAALEVRVVSGPQAGEVHPLVEGDTVVGGPGADLVLTGLTGKVLLLQTGASGVVATGLDPSDPVRRSGVPLLTTMPVLAADQLAVGGHLLAVGPVEPDPPDVSRPYGGLG